MRHTFSILFRHYLLLLISSSSLALFISCNSGDLNFITPQTETQRVLIVYLAGDNSLSSEIEQKITALTDGFIASTNHSQNRLFIYYDRKNASPQLIQINAKAERQVIKDYPPQNSASGKVFAQITKYILDNYSATSYGLIFFSHGTAWLPAKGLDNPYTLSSNSTYTVTNPTRTVATDNSDEMELTDFASSLPLPDGKKWTFILFEGCYMGSIEVAYELKDKTETIIASPTEIVSPGMKDVYPMALTHLYQPSPNLESFARSYFDLWNSKTGDYRSATISVIRTEHLAELATLARASFVRWNPDEETISNLQCFNRNKWHLFFDLKEALLTANPALESYITDLWKDIVIYAAATPSFLPGMAYGFTIRAYSGLTCYIPQNEFLAANQGYMQTAWCETVYE